MARFISYLRVSTVRQGAAGLGIEAQRAAVQAHVAACRGELLEEVVEVESGRKTERIKLDAALALCRLYGATLIIARIDRLARNVAFVSRLMDEGVEFVACDFPQANRLTIHIMAAMAEYEAAMISARTKAALAAAKARGVTLGTAGRHNLTPAGRAAGSLKGNIIKTAAADRFAVDLMRLIVPLRQEGVSLAGVARTLTDRGISPPRGGAWSAMTVKRVLDRAALPCA